MRMKRSVAVKLVSLWLSQSSQRRISRRSPASAGPNRPSDSGEVVENHARLREAQAAVLEHRCLAHDVDVAVGAAARFTAEVVDEPRRPVGAG